MKNVMCFLCYRGDKDLEKRENESENENMSGK